MITSLEELVEYINGDDYNKLVVEEAIDRNGWIDTSGRSDYDVCQFGNRKVVLDENTAEAKIVYIDTMYLIGKAVALIESTCEGDKGFPNSFVSVCAPPKKSQSFIYWCREALRKGCEDLCFIADLDYSSMVMADPSGRYWVGYYQTKGEISKQKERVRIGKLVMELRKKKGYTLQKLADLCGINLQNIAKIEKGKYNVSIDILGRIATALDAKLIID